MNVGVVGDPHAPFTHPLYLKFCQDTFRKHKVDHTHFAGDVVDHHAISFHDHDAEGRSAGDEGDEAEKQIAKWHKAFPGATVSIGNHDERHLRLAKKAGLPCKRYLRNFNEIWQTPTWKWDYEHVIDGVLYTHGTGTSGKNAAINLAIQRRMSTVIGHVHSWGGIQHHANASSRIFGMNCGCGIDDRRYAFEYGRVFPVKPILGCGVVIDGDQAQFIVMPCGKGERYHRSRAGKIH